MRRPSVGWPTVDFLASDAAGTSQLTAVPASRQATRPGRSGRARRRSPVRCASPSAASPPSVRRTRWPARSSRERPIRSARNRDRGRPRRVRRAIGARGLCRDTADRRKDPPAKDRAGLETSRKCEKITQNRLRTRFLRPPGQSALRPSRPRRTAPPREPSFVGDDQMRELFVLGQRADHPQQRGNVGRRRKPDRAVDCGHAMRPPIIDRSRSTGGEVFTPRTSRR